MLIPPENQNCFCCSDLPFDKCCQPIISGLKRAPNAEALMRSRFSAYVLKDYLYILNSYTEAQRSKLSVEELAQSAENTLWLSLQVISYVGKGTTTQVEFKAYYQLDGRFYVMHELSDFVLENEDWRYTTGLIKNSSGEIKPKRNGECLCGSGNKFKKCCGK